MHFLSLFFFLRNTGIFTTTIYLNAVQKKKKKSPPDSELLLLPYRKGDFRSPLYPSGAHQCG